MLNTNRFEGNHSSGDGGIGAPHFFLIMLMRIKRGFAFLVVIIRIHIRGDQEDNNLCPTEESNASMIFT